MRNYLKRLRGHPGLPVALVLTPAFMLAGLANENPTAGFVMGSIASVIVWCIVLWTALKQGRNND